MQEPNRIPLTDNPRVIEPKRIRLETQYLDSIEDDLWEKHEVNHAPPVFAKNNENNENNQQNNTSSIQQLESDKTS